MPPEDMQPKPLTEAQKNKIKRMVLLVIGWFLIISGAARIAEIIAALKLGAVNGGQLDVASLIFIVIWMGLGVFLVDKSKTFKSAKKSRPTKARNS